MNKLQFVALLFLFRFACAILIRYSFFNPDEYFQSLEVAHKLVFGYGHLTWEWKAGLRSYLHPVLYVPAWTALKLLGLDSTLALDLTARLLQSAVAAGCDFFVHSLARDVFGPEAASWTLLLQLGSWFNGYCLPRSYINCLEALALVAILSAWLRAQPSPPTRAKRSPGRVSPAAAASDGRGTRALCTLAMSLVFVARPTVAPACATLWLSALLGLPGLPRASLREVLFPSGAAALLGLGLGALLDSSLYGRWTFAPWEFLKFNVLSGGSALYGTHPFHWNYSQGLPAVLVTFLPLVVLGSAHLLSSARSASARNPRALLLLALLLASVLPYDLAAHKEFRFLLPALQLSMPICGHALAVLQHASAPQAASKVRHSAARMALALWRRGGRAILALLLLVQACMLLYLGLVHQTGAVRAMASLERLIRTDLRARDAQPEQLSVLLAMPCHATPLYSWLHLNVAFRFPDCSPPAFVPEEDERVLNATAVGPSRRRLRTMTDLFTHSPSSYLALEGLYDSSGRFAPLVKQRRSLDRSQLPQYVLLFDRTYPEVADQLSAFGFAQVETLFHAHLGGDYGPQDRVLLYRRP